MTYFTPEAARGREQAEQFWDWTEGEYLPLGKYEMVLGGVGSVRLSPRFVRGGEVCFFAASANGISHQGIPVVVPIETGQRILRKLKDHGSISGSITGTLWPLPLDQSPLRFDRGIPKYYLFSEEIISRDSSQSKPLVTVAITYSSTYEGSPESVGEFKVNRSKNWSFASFDPSQGRDALQETIVWLKKYAIRHSSTYEQGKGKELPPELVSIVGDFDEMVRHFDNPVEFPLSSILAGQYDPRLLEFYGNAFHITIDRKVVVNMAGDIFSNIGAGATIVNRSTVQNAFNKVKSEHGEEVAQALNQVEEEINKSGNKDAADTFNSFNEELQKPQPKKSVLQALWHGVVTAVPAIGQLSDVIGRIKTLFAG